MIKKEKVKTTAARTKNTKTKKSVSTKKTMNAKTKKKSISNMKKTISSKPTFDIPKVQPGHIKEDLKWISENQNRSANAIRENKGYHKMPKSHTGTRHH